MILRWHCLVALAALVVVAPSSFAEPSPIEQLEINGPRTFGYQIGDRVTRQINFRLRKPFAVEASSFPEPGRVNPWLDVASPQISVVELNGSNEYRIQLDYQLVNVKADVPSVPLPRIILKYSDGNEQLQLLVPATRLSVSLLNVSDDQAIQADQAPAVRRFDYRLIGVAGAVLGLSVIGLVWLQWGGPRLGLERPFSALARQLKRYRIEDLSDDAYRELLQAVHRAFNAVAGHSVFADKLDQFFLEQPQYVVCETDVRAFFLHSRGQFFAEGGQAEQNRLSANELSALVTQLSDVERGLA